MSRGKKSAKSKPKDDLDSTHRLCQHCHQYKLRRGFPQHQQFCAATLAIEPPSKRPRLSHQTSQEVLGPDTDTINDTVHEPQDTVNPPSLLDSEDTEPQQPLHAPALPQVYIKVLPHPHSPLPITITPLDAPSGQAGTTFIPKPSNKPWAPFRTLEDFEITEFAVTTMLKKEKVNTLLAGVNERWTTGGSKVTLHRYEDMQESLEYARAYVVQFTSDEVTVPYKGEMHTFKFEYRDPWKYVLSLVRDESLAPLHCWNAVKKFYCEDGKEERVIDEPNTADTWWGVDSELPEPDPYPHCFLPLHFWLDKGLVTSRVKAYPMILRPAWLPREIRNGSGNGGGVLLGYMPMVKDPADPSDRKTAETLEFAQFKRNVYHKVLGRVFEPLRLPSHHGEAHCCGDKVVRILHPGILIESQDGEEATYFCACRGSLANVPCTKCLAPKSELHRITKRFPLRTPETMKEALQKARQAPNKTQKDKILQDFGLHDIDHFLWNYRFSDPYAASSYDTLHSDDIGKWGKHLWPLLLSVLEEAGRKGRFAANLAMFPRWANLKHFDAVTTSDIKDGQAYLDILKCVLPCIVQLLPRGSALVHCIRAYAKYRMLVGMHCMPESRRQHLIRSVSIYEKSTEKVNQDHDKNFAFPKNHATGHVGDEILNKGTTDNMTTRTGEGFQQEAAEAYAQTNKKQAEHQMARIDETQEIVARIRMLIDNDKKAPELQETQSDEDEGDLTELSEQPRSQTGPWEPPQTISGAPPHWKFGSPSQRAESSDLESISEDSHFVGFDEKLRTFLLEVVPEERLRFEDTIECAYIHYQSREDWSLARDIIRCNKLFHGRERFDCVVVNMDLPGLVVARVRALLRCKLPSGKVLDLAIVKMLSRTQSWKPNTVWSGCEVHEEDKNPSFILMDYIVRGCLVSPTFDSKAPHMFYLVDTVDEDMFLRASNIF
ncbi:hypothetical protein H0H93_005308 [Arthromyces matolae]|nr:hypothetical protein H0H93_005308 [Arthromyces matolae]